MKFYAGEEREIVGPAVMADYVASLVEIADQLGDPLFGRFHRRLALSFSIVMFRIIGRHSTTSRNCSATRRMLLFIANLIISFGAQYTGTKGEDKTFWRLAQRGSAILRSSFLHSFSYICSFLLSSVHVFPPTPNT
uniref:Uncharacterized protein n=1 Tax=Solanum tuberosum TaxID=4113 RepID=M1DD04_SOLTU